jgi:hypothetical protein
MVVENEGRAAIFEEANGFCNQGNTRDPVRERKGTSGTHSFLAGSVGTESERRLGRIRH